ncbi:MAG: serine hydrolase domain-containing protein, partial [Planctomycetota bacterium]
QLHCLILFYIVLFPLVLTGCKSTEPDFNNLEEAVEYYAEKYVKMGAAIGIIDKQQDEQEFYFGTTSNYNSNRPNRHSIFEIGSITKTFTATLLAQMILNGKIRLEEEAGSLLPAGEITLPVWKNTPITIEHLATHSSGLPKTPHDSEKPKPSGYDPYDPYAAYNTEYVYDYLTNYCDLRFKPGTKYFYSNTGIGLLGHILGLLGGTTYEELVTREIFESLGMDETSLFVEHNVSNLAPGHDNTLDSVKNYNANDIFQGAGFIKSSLNDMMIYLKAQMGLIKTSLSDAMKMTQQAHFDVDGDLSIGLAWHIKILPEGHTFHSHGGRTNGYMAYMAFDLTTSTGVVILCNQSEPNVIIRFGEKVMKAVYRY